MYSLWSAAFFSSSRANPNDSVPNFDRSRPWIDGVAAGQGRAAPGRRGTPPPGRTFVVIQQRECVRRRARVPSPGPPTAMPRTAASVAACSRLSSAHSTHRSNQSGPGDHVEDDPVDRHCA